MIEPLDAVVAVGAVAEPWGPIYFASWAKFIAKGVRSLQHDYVRRGLFLRRLRDLELFWLVLIFEVLSRGEPLQSWE